MAGNQAEQLILDSEGKISCRPFLKWVGGKGQLLKELLKRVPKNFTNYYEPFLGGGALYFALQPKQAFLSDFNSELINAYEVVRNNCEALVSDLRKHIYEADYYYNMRDIDRTDEYDNWGPVQRASRLIYLNKTCYNGLYRINSKGFFNTPIGKYSNPKILDAENLRACSEVLKSANISSRDFVSIEQSITSHDFVYFDPPYVPVSPTSNFTSYDERGFDHNMHKKLLQLCYRLDARNVRFLLSNSAAPFVFECYKHFKIQKVFAPRVINSKAKLRGVIQELLISNY